MKQDKLKIAGIVCGAIAAILIVAGFICPPLAIIDNSVLIGSGEIFAFAGLFMAWDSIEKGISTKISHKDTTIELNKKEENKE